ncbi:FecR family protein [Paraburkholderia sp. BL23I1N1]|uniref:FecR family protein n=1 Tax=Paraburkholderia sp. BL23I1N1 TaxID=1938802 RepID=UPI000E76D9E8|nr:FecR domain-containing protein [Paraburkholderia sp. BL23I1N1]RKE37493.1 FecR family protein [Paraburkholderia sp. BL23I1N1]
MKRVTNTPHWHDRTMFRLARQLLFLLVMLGCGSSAYAQAVGTVTHLSGVLTVKHADGGAAVLAINSSILQGDTLVTEANTYTRVKFVDNGEMVVRPSSQVVVKSYVYDVDHPEKDNVAIRLVAGGLRSVTGLIGKRNHDAVSFETPTGTIGVRGTNFGALFCQNDCGGVPTTSGRTPQNGLYVDVSQGAVVLSNPAGQHVFQSGDFGYVANLNAPPIVIPPTQGVPVTMPLSISKNAPASQNSSSTSHDVDCVVQ